MRFYSRILLLGRNASKLLLPRDRRHVWTCFTVALITLVWVSPRRHGKLAAELPRRKRSIFFGTLGNCGALVKQPKKYLVFCNVIFPACRGLTRRTSLRRT